jgi:DNA-binding protein HU-beta
MDKKEEERRRMNKKDLVALLADKGGHTKAKAAEALDILTDAVTGALKKGDKVALVGFGTFSVSKRAARTAINPQTKAKMKVPAANVPKFKAGKELKDAVNKKKK